MTDQERLESYKKQLENQEDNLLRIELRMSEFPLPTNVPLEYVKAYDVTVKAIEKARERIEILSEKIAQSAENASVVGDMAVGSMPQVNPAPSGNQPPVAVQPAEPPEFTFVAGPPVIHPKHFFGRARLVKRIFGQWKTLPLQNVAIIGDKRTGKTSLLRLCEQLTRTPKVMLRSGQRNDWLAAPEQYRWVFVDFQNAQLATQDGLMTYVLQELGFPVPEPCTMAAFTKIMSDYLQQPTILLMDEVGVAIEKYADLDPDFWTGLRSLATNYVDGRLGFVVAAHSSPLRLAKQVKNSSPFFNIFGYSVKLGPLEEVEARELLACSPIPFAEEDIDWILEQSGCWPILVQILARERLVALEDEDESEDWKEEGLMQIEPFSHLLNPAGA